MLPPGDDDGPGCSHECCLFERDCLVVQAELELLEARADNLVRRERGADLLHAMGAPLELLPLLLVALHSPAVRTRVAAAGLLQVELVRGVDEVETTGSTRDPGRAA